MIDGCGNTEEKGGQAAAFQVILIRHGETDWNRLGRWQGHRDIALNDQGRQQAEALARRLAHGSFAAVLSSDLGRAWETAAILSNAHGLQAFRDPRLREFSLGQADGTLLEERSLLFGRDLLDQWRSYALEHAEVRFPGGESKAEAASRLGAGLLHFHRTHGFACFAALTHGGIMAAFLNYSFPDRQGEIGAIGNCFAFRISFDAAGRPLGFAGE